MTTPVQSERNRRLLLVFLIGVVIALGYGGTLAHRFIWDDEWLVLDNPQLSSPSLKIFTHPLKIPDPETPMYYRPLQVVSYLMDYSLWGFRPVGYHLTSLFLHGLNLFLIILLLWRVASAPQIVSAGIAVAYGLHPWHVPTVAYVSGRADLLAVAGLLLMLLFYWRGKLFAAVLSLSAALLSKETGLIGLPLVVLMAFEKAQWNYKAVDWKALRPFLGVGLIYLFWRLMLQASLPVFQSPQSFHERLAMLPFILATDLRLFFFSFDPQLRRVILPPSSLWMGWSAGILLLSVLLCIIRFWRRVPWSRFWLGWIFVTLLPTLHLLFPLKYSLADHWLVLPGIGMCGLIAQGYSHLSWRKGKRWIVCFLLAWGMGNFFMTRVYARQWSSSFTLYPYLLSRNPSEVKIRLAYGDKLLSVGRFADCIEQSAQVLAQRPLNGKNGHSLEEMAWVEMSRASVAQGRLPQAFWAAQEAAAIQGSPISYAALGLVYFQKGNDKLAESAFIKSVELDPTFELGWTSLGHFYYERRRWKQAVGAYSRLVHLRPDSSQYRQWLADACLENGKSK